MTEHEPWLSLPDEDPPERGFAELMAAARAKAEIMANPPWWKRLGELLRRPPVLALATVVVLIGGVIIVHREPAEMAPVASPPASGEATPVEPAGFGAPQSPPPPPVVENKPAGTREKAVESRTDTSKLARPDNAHAETGGVLVPKGPAEEASVRDDAVKQELAADTAVEQAPVGHTAETTQVQKAQLAKQRAQTPAESLARCRAAAANNDCAGARACAKQLETESPAFYNANVANDATLRSCL